MADSAIYGSPDLPSLWGDSESGDSGGGDSGGGGFVAVVVGASGGIGSALMGRLHANPNCRQVLGFARKPNADSTFIDLDDEASIATAAEFVAQESAPALIIGAIGVLHRSQLMPEKSYRQLTHHGLMAYYRANCIAPAMLAKHFLPLLSGRGKAVFALLSGRVGSISDNRIGGWHGYRASKSALNMMIRNFALEMARVKPGAVVLGLHPGTVATPLSQPFRGGVKHPILTPDESATHLLAVIDGARAEHSGHQLDWRGAIIPA